MSAPDPPGSDHELRRPAPTPTALEAFLFRVQRHTLDEARRRRDSGDVVMSQDGRERVGVPAVLFVPADRLVPSGDGGEATLAPPHGPLEDWCIEIFGRLICFGDGRS
jgi:hypothetical protein